MICNSIIIDNDCNSLMPYEEFEEGNVYIYIFLLNKADGSTISQVFILENSDLEIKFTIQLDGYYSVCKIKLVTEEKLLSIPLEELISDNTSNPNKYNSYGFYYKNKSFYKGLEEVQLSDILSAEESDLETKNLEIEYSYYFQLCRLKKCYIAAAKAILDKRASIRCNSGDVSSEDIYKRDLLWSAINTITYLVEMDQYEEAERLLERITSCNGLCDNTSEKTSNYNCGCGG